MPNPKDMVVPVVIGEEFRRFIDSVPVVEFGKRRTFAARPCECCGDSGLVCASLCAGCTHPKAGDELAPPPDEP